MTIPTIVHEELEKIYKELEEFSEEYELGSLCFEVEDALESIKYVLDAIEEDGGGMTLISEPWTCACCGMHYERGKVWPYLVDNHDGRTFCKDCFCKHAGVHVMTTEPTMENAGITYRARWEE